jgi:hypothetical protein
VLLFPLFDVLRSAAPSFQRDCRPFAQAEGVVVHWGRAKPSTRSASNWEKKMSTKHSLHIRGIVQVAALGSFRCVSAACWLRSLVRGLAVALFWEVPFVLPSAVVLLWQLCLCYNTHSLASHCSVPIRYHLSIVSKHIW